MGAVGPAGLQCRISGVMFGTEMNGPRQPCYQTPSCLFFLSGGQVFSRAVAHVRPVREDQQRSLAVWRFSQLRKKCRELLGVPGLDFDSLQIVGVVR